MNSLLKNLKIVIAFLIFFYLPHFVISQDTNDLSAPEKDSAYKRETSFTHEVVSFKNQSRETLKGTLSLPEGQGPFTACLLVMDHSPMVLGDKGYGWKLEATLADFLNRKGLAVLTYVNPRYSDDPIQSLQPTMTDLANDAKAAFDFLRSDQRVVPSRIGIIGWGIGGLTGSMVATQNLAVGFLVMLAAPCLPGDQSWILMEETLMKGSGFSDKEIKANSKLNKECKELILKQSDASAVHSLLLDWIRNRQGSWHVSLSVTGTTPITQPDSLTDLINSKWFRSYLALEPSLYQNQLRCPVFALFGEKDVEIPAEYHSKQLKKNLLKAENPDNTLVIFPGVNHRFQTSDTGMPAEYKADSQSVSTKLLDSIYSWIRQKTK